MAKTDSSRERYALDLESVRDGLRSDDAETRARAVRSLCPCRMGWTAFQECLVEVRRLQKDPSPPVRAAALHVLQDALEMDSSGLPTSRRETTNEMAARRRHMRFRRDS